MALWRISFQLIGIARQISYMAGSGKVVCRESRMELGWLFIHGRCREFRDAEFFEEEGVDVGVFFDLGAEGGAHAVAGSGVDSK